MFLNDTQQKKERAFFEHLCEEYYEKVLKYLYHALNSENAARDCTQEVFLTVWRKCAILRQHPNPGGFLFQTAKTLARKVRRESYARLLADVALDELENEPADEKSSIDSALDREINEWSYVEPILDELSDEKIHLYRMYYSDGKSMAEIAKELGLEEPALRMRYVRLRREIRGIVSRVAGEYFSS